MSRILADKVPPLKYPDKPPRPKPGAEFDKLENLECIAEKERKRRRLLQRRKDAGNKELRRREKDRKKLERELAKTGTMLCKLSYHLHI